RLRVSGSAPRLLLIGDAAGASDPTNRLANAELEALLAPEGLGQAVQRTGWLPPEAVSAHLQACDVVVLPYRDGASLRRGSLLAALVHGLPIVTTWRGEGGMERGRAGEQGRERERRGAGGWPAD